MPGASDEERGIYRRIMKGAAVFGGTQAVQVLTSIVRGKLVALILGAAGMGVSALLYSAMQPVQQLFALGLPTAAVGAVNGAEDDGERWRRVAAFRRVTLWLGLAAMAFMALASPLLDSLVFGGRTAGGRMPHSLWFAGLGVAVLLQMLAAAENTILQCIGRLRRLALCNATGPVAGLLTGVPLYWAYGVDGIMPAIVTLSAATWGVTRWQTRGLVPPLAPLSVRGSVALVRPMAALGVAMTAMAVAATLVTLAVNAFVNRLGTTADVGFYAAAVIITQQCTSMVFAALSTDYYPRLSSLASDAEATREFMSQEAEVSVLVAAPLAVCLTIAAPVVVPLLLSREFAAIVPLVSLMSLTFVMRAYYQPLDYLCLARSDRRLYLINECMSAFKTLVLMCGGYWLFGLLGLGYGAVACAATDVALSVALVRWRYGIAYRRRTHVLALTLVTLTALTTAAALTLGGGGGVVPGVLTAGVAARWLWRAAR